MVSYFNINLLKIIKHIKTSVFFGSISDNEAHSVNQSVFQTRAINKVQGSFSGFSALSALFILLMLIIGFNKTNALADSNGEIVVFTANWCASCREVVPLAKDIATGNQLGFTVIDVDANTAPKQTATLGLNLPKQGPPQVFFVNKRQKQLLYNGESYKFGYSDAARTTILQNLQQALH